MPSLPPILPPNATACWNCCKATAVVRWPSRADWTAPSWPRRHNWPWAIGPWPSPASSASLAAGELEECVDLARQIGIRHEVLQTEELSVPGYQENNGNRCYFCKTELFLKVEQLAERLGVAVVCDGTNHDDRGDHRPGMQAGRERQVRSPLAECELTKAEIRELAVAWDLPIWDKPATPCLSSRIAYGETVTPERLAMIGAAERSSASTAFSPCGSATTRATWRGSRSRPTPCRGSSRRAFAKRSSSS